MSDSRTFIIEKSNTAWATVVENACKAIREWAQTCDFQVKLSDIVRSLDQNAAMWPALKDWSTQVEWKINDAPQLIQSDDWKDILTAAFECEMRMAPGLSGGFVMLGTRTSKYGKKRMGEFLSFLRAEGDERGVRWSAPAKANFDEYIERAA